MLLKFLCRLGVAEVITGKGDTIYLIRFNLTPSTRWGQLLFHVFYRGDEDPDPHDHPWRFWTCPWQTYLEEVMQHDGTMKAGLVERWRWNKRSWHHTHRVMPDGNQFPLYTLVWRGPYVPGLTWGFWLDATRPGSEEYEDLIGWHVQTNPQAGSRIKVPWRTYLFKEKQKEAI